MRESSKKLAYGALGAAVGFLPLYLSTLLPTGTLALLCAASLGVVFVRMSCGVKWALGCYAVTAALGLLLLPSKGNALAYALFAGCYPLIKLWIERNKSILCRYGAKLLFFNAVFAVLYFFAAMLLTPGEAPPFPIWLLFLLANAVFLVYDFALTQAILIYIRKIARRIH